jgi:hypothetical protein
MADFALWAAACETALWPTGTFARAYEGNRRAAIDDAIDADPVASCVRELLAERGSWSGSAADLLRVGGDPVSNGGSTSRAGWPSNLRALAGRLRRAQTFLRALGIEIAFAREGRGGNRIIRMHRGLEDRQNRQQRPYHASRRDTIGIRTASGVGQCRLRQSHNCPDSMPPGRARARSRPVTLLTVLTQRPPMSRPAGFAALAPRSEPCFVAKLHSRRRLLRQDCLPEFVLRKQSRSKLFALANCYPPATVPT